MIVQRLKSWAHSLLVACHQLHAPSPHAHEAVGVASPQRPGRSHGGAASATQGGWLMDGRRLRPELRPPLDGPTLGGGAQLRQVGHDEPASQDATDGRARQPMRSRPLHPQSPAASAEGAPPFVSRASEASSAQDAFATFAEADAAQRRLLVLRYLVRQRVYHEGFERDAIPEQYQRSMEGTPSPDDRHDGRQ